MKALYTGCYFEMLSSQQKQQDETAKKLIEKIPFKIKIYC